MVVGPWAPPVTSEGLSLIILNESLEVVLNGFARLRLSRLPYMDLRARVGDCRS